MQKILLFSFFCWSAMILFPSCSSNHLPPKQERIFPITIGEVIQKEIPIYIEAIGHVDSLQIVQIRPQVGGIIQEAYVQQGQYVKKGDPLYKIDPRPYQANLDRAKANLTKDLANLKFAEEQVKRYSEVVKKEFVAKLTYDQYLSQVELNRGQVLSDEAEIELAELNLEWCIPESPINGKISQFNIYPGNLVTANDPNALTDIRQMTPADIRFNITQSEFIEVQKSLKQGPLQFEVILPQETHQPRKGNIYFIDNHINPTTGTILLKGAISNEDAFLWPGEFIRVRLLLRNEPHALLIPEEAVKIGYEGHYVYIYLPESSTVEYRRVTLIKGGKIDQWVAIQEGIQPGEKVVVRGQNNLLPGAKVLVASSQEKP